ncbi:hypothetical protein DPMN_134826 [Dreissena polymorpha]|uniref:Uncharacterized protein n=1 Tax=Dreissena polymorpha TaxID=45954 RepID=A0A9D4FY11_DREPO|nr:hypothetical protein DPMN_134826 [Dreissena polymorpha]
MARQRPTRKLYVGGTPKWVMWTRMVEIDRVVIRNVEYLFEFNWCINEEVMFKQNFGWAGRPTVGNGAMHLVKIDRFLIKEIQYQLEVNRCRNEECEITKTNDVGGGSGQDGQTYGRNNHIIPRSNLELPVDLSINLKEDGKKLPLPLSMALRLVMWTSMVEIDRVVIRDVQY